MDIKSLNLDELTEYIVSLGEKKFRAKQIYRWLHVDNVMSYDEMKNIPLALRNLLKEKSPLIPLKVEDLQISKIDGTRKYLFLLHDENMIEAVLMRYKYGNSICISSEVGCAMGCRFCASGIGGLVRELTASEMLDQVYAIQNDIGEKVQNIVIMGTGEPLNNFTNVLKFIKMVSDENGLHISQRNITVSTSGIVPQIERLQKENLKITLALSLHSTTQERRAYLMPVAGRYDIKEAIDAMRQYEKATKRRVSFEYSLIKGENDTDEDAERLTKLLDGILCHVNLIPVNPIKERDFKKPDNSAVIAFQKKLEKNGINVTIRRELGRDIDGACGQLRRRHMKGKN